MVDPDPEPPVGSPPGAPGRRSAVAELDSRFRRSQKQLVERLDDLDRRVSDLTSAVAEVLPRLEDLADGVAEARGRLDAESSSLSGSTFTPVHWPSLTAEEAAVAWESLGHWVGAVLGPWYGVTRGQLPDCWALHRRAVLELSWLRTSYVVAYSSKASASMAAEWHSRWLREALAAVSKAIPEQLCRPGFHLVVGGRRAPAPSPAASASPEIGAGRRYIDPRHEVTEPRHWRPAFDHAVRLDLAAREGEEGKV